MSETQMWRYMKHKLQGSGFYIERTSDRTKGGFPDSIWSAIHPALHSPAAGFIEFKFMKEIEAGKPFSLPELRADQALFLRRWVRNNGYGAVLLRIQKPETWRLYLARSNMSWIVSILGPEPKHDFEWDKFPDPEEFLDALVSNWVLRNYDTDRRK